MNETINRRTFIKTTTAAAGLALAAQPRSLFAADAKIPMAFVGCAHIHTPGFVNLLKSRPDVAVGYVWDHQRVRAEARASELQAKVSLQSAITGLHRIEGSSLQRYSVTLP